jgi:hypothetical protein
MALMTRLAVVRSGAGCLGRQAASSSPTSRTFATPQGSSSSPSLRSALRKAAPGAVATHSRRPVVVTTRAVSTAAGEASTAAPAAVPFKRHERIASIKVRGEWRWTWERAGGFVPIRFVPPCRRRAHVLS